MIFIRRNGSTQIGIKTDWITATHFSYYREPLVTRDEYSGLFDAKNTRQRVDVLRSRL